MGCGTSVLRPTEGGLRSAGISARHAAAWLGPRLLQLDKAVARQPARMLGLICAPTGSHLCFLVPVQAEEIFRLLGISQVRTAVVVPVFTNLSDGVTPDQKRNATSPGVWKGPLK